MFITREKLLKISAIGVTLVICMAVVGLILSGLNHFKVGSQLAGINHVSNLSHLLVRQQAKFFSLLLIKNSANEELVDALDTFAKEDFVIDATLYNTNGSMLAQSRHARPFQLNINPQTDQAPTPQPTQQIVEPIFNQQNLIGFLRVTFNAEYGQTTQSRVNALFHLLYGELIILFLAGGLFISCFYVFRRRLPAVGHLPAKPQNIENKPASQRYHARRRALNRRR